ncbi:tail fiber protein [Algoriphagus sp. C2-6-M1]|uniref:phage tail protein n=1 Tax=Algoriphagus persicinus TaxID=3108754 RepID=UPI002B37FA83|nr:tail fiber protein [Algoriphagus sp. C2-6-M1]MEB2779833.1 tail fiber protein [Algoriphagus sp. C2-6-M1]
MDELLATIKLFSGNFAPRGYMSCEGQILSISNYTALFSLLGTQYGGNGSTTFALPDLRGRAPIGVGSGPGLSTISQGENGGTEQVTLTVNNLPNHSHPLNVSTSTGITNNPQGNFIAEHNVTVERNGQPIAGSSFNASPNAQMAATAIGAVGGNIPVAIRNPYLGLRYIICVEGIFPSRN